MFKKISNFLKENVFGPDHWFDFGFILGICISFTFFTFFFIQVVNDVSFQLFGKII